MNFSLKRESRGNTPVQNWDQRPQGLRDQRFGHASCQPVPGSHYPTPLLLRLAGCTSGKMGSSRPGLQGRLNEIQDFRFLLSKWEGTEFVSSVFPCTPPPSRPQLGCFPSKDASGTEEISEVMVVIVVTVKQFSLSERLLFARVRVPQTVPAPVPVRGIRSPNLCRREAELAACRLLRKPTGTPKGRLGGRAGEDSEGSHGCPLNHSSAMGKPKEGERGEKERFWWLKLWVQTTRLRVPSSGSRQQPRMVPNPEPASRQ